MGIHAMLTGMHMSIIVSDNCGQDPVQQKLQLSYEFDCTFWLLVGIM
jgi:hypothetical protein